MKVHGQADLFGIDTRDKVEAAERARKQMRRMIDRLRNMTLPDWKDQMAVWMEDSSFKSAMREVSTEEGEAFWAEYDVEAERLFVIWAADPARGDLRIPLPSEGLGPDTV